MGVTSKDLHDLCERITSNTDADALDLALLENIAVKAMRAFGLAHGKNLDRLVNLLQEVIEQHAGALGISSEIKAAGSAVHRAGEVLAYIATYSEPDLQPLASPTEPSSQGSADR